jgi:ADP-ribosylglycohydrolase
MGTAAGDALGAPYEFGPSLPAETPVTMHAGGVWEKGEWTDDTAMALAIAQVAAQGLDLRDEEAQDGIVQRWIEWAFDPKTKDVGIQTRHVLSSANRHGGTAAAARRAAEETHARQGKSGGNGSLMRTAPVALAYLGDEAALTEAAQAIARLTHYERDNGDACVLWCHAIRHAVLTGELDARVGLPQISADRRDYWAARLDDAEQHDPAHFSHNGWVVEALQGAWSAIKRTPVPREDPPGGRFRADHLRLALENAVRGGRDTDTVAAIAGGLLGATWGVAAVPALWRADLHGWPGLRPHDLDQLTQAITGGGAARRARDYSDVPRQPLVKLPRDPGVLLGNVQAALHPSGADFDAVVSLCEIAPDLRAARPWIEVFLIDKADPDANQQLGFVLEDTVRAISQLRDDGHRVLLHCVYAQSRTPTVAALYTMRRFGVDESTARHEVQAALGGQFSGNEAFREALRKADGAPQGGGAGLRVP